MRHAAELELFEFLGEGVAAVGFELEMELLEFLGEGAAHAAVEVAETVDGEAVGHEATDMNAEKGFDELGL